MEKKMETTITEARAAQKMFFYSLNLMVQAQLAKCEPQLQFAGKRPLETAKHHLYGIHEPSGPRYVFEE